MRLTALAVILLALPAHAADIFESKNTGYSLIYSDDWSPDSKTTDDNISLTCTLPICQGTIVASVLPAADYRRAEDTPASLFTLMHPDAFVVLVKSNAEHIGRVTTLDYPQRVRIGNVEGYIGTFRITYRDTRVRHMIYGIVLNKGYFYHIQFQSVEAPNADMQKLAASLFDGFQINASE